MNPVAAVGAVGSLVFLRQSGLQKLSNPRRQSRHLHRHNRRLHRRHRQSLSSIFSVAETHCVGVGGDGCVGGSGGCVGGGSVVGEPLEALLAVKRFGEDGAAALLETGAHPPRPRQRHFRLRRRRRHHREDILLHPVQTREGHAQTFAVLEVTQSSGETVEKKSHRRRLVLAERLGEVTALTPVPKETWKRKRRGMNG